jgi:putative proteasome-type protease
MGTSLEVAAKYALLSFDATMRSNVTVGPPIDLLLYKKNDLTITRYRRLSAFDQDLNLIHASWEQSLRRAVEQLPEIHFEEPDRAQHAAGEWRPRPRNGDQS